MSEKYECLRKASRACVLDRCTSMKGSAVPSSASRSAMLVCVKAPGLMMPKATASPLARCTRSMSSCSALLWKAISSCPSSRASAALRCSIASRVSVPYTVGSRVPSRLRLGPFSNSTRAMGLGLSYLGIYNKRRGANVPQFAGIGDPLAANSCNLAGLSLSGGGALCAAGSAQAGHAGADLLARGGQIQGAPVEVRHTIQDKRCLIRVQLADLQGDDASAAIGNHRKRQDRIHSEGVGRFQAAFLPDEERVADVPGERILRHVIAIIEGDADNFDPIFRTIAADQLQQRDLTPAGLAPSGPEIQHQQFAAKLADAA